MAKIKNLVLCDWQFPQQVIYQFMKDNYKTNLIDVISFPDLIQILSPSRKSDKQFTFLMYNILKMVRLHPSIERIVFLVDKNNANTELKSITAALLHLLSINNINIIRYTHQDKEIILENKNRGQTWKYNNIPIVIHPTLSIECSDGRFTKIKSESQLSNGENFLSVKYCYVLRLPGGSLAFTTSDEYKQVFNVLMENIFKHGITEIYNEHHGPDCGAFCSLHGIDDMTKLDSAWAYDQHRINMTIVWKKIINSKNKKEKEANKIIDLEIYTRYLEFDALDKILHERHFLLLENDEMVIENEDYYQAHAFDPKKLKSLVLV